MTAKEKPVREDDAPLSEEWLSAAGFKWSQGERQPQKHWRLLIGWASDSGMACIEDLGVEVAMAWWPNHKGDPVGDVWGWNCWLFGMNRSFLHVRHIKTQGDLLRLIEALTGQPWDSALSRYGNLYHTRHLAMFRDLNDAPADLANRGEP